MTREGHGRPRADRAARAKLWGYLVVVVLATVTRAVAPVAGLDGFGSGLLVVLLGAVAVHLVVRRHDPSARFWRRPDQLPEGQDQVVEPPTEPW